MNEKNVKWYLADTEKEICIGDAATITKIIEFSKYPDLTASFTITRPIEEEDIKSLKKEDLITEKEEKPVEDYCVYLKWLADVEGMPATDVYKAFSTTLQINRNAALSILLKAISRKFRKKTVLEYIPAKVWLINTDTMKPFITDVYDPKFLDTRAWFSSKEDADYAIKVCNPIITFIKK